jgi:hypothetical protein
MYRAHTGARGRGRIRGRVLLVDDHAARDGDQPAGTATRRRACHTAAPASTIAPATA